MEIHLIRYAGLLMASRPDAAGLAQTISSWPDAWHKTVGQYLLQQLNETDFLARASTAPSSATTSSQRGMAAYYIAVIKLSTGDKTGSRTFLEECVSLSSPVSYEHRLASAELSRLETAK